VVARIARRLHLAPVDLIIVFDDLDLPLGKVRVRMSGSAGGHNGVRSLITALGTDALRRVKIGIGRPEPPPGSGQRRDEVVDHVLSAFEPEEQDTVTAACEEAAQQAIKLLDRREGA
jgi:PTH1 family peptidyl-tRNA hydrolase